LFAGLQQAILPRIADHHFVDAGRLERVIQPGGSVVSSKTGCAYGAPPSMRIRFSGQLEERGQSVVQAAVVGRFSSDHYWPDLSDCWGLRSGEQELPAQSAVRGTHQFRHHVMEFLEKSKAGRSFMSMKEIAITVHRVVSLN
jgi:hypothetical protein